MLRCNRIFCSVSLSLLLEQVKVKCKNMKAFGTPQAKSSFLKIQTATTEEVCLPISRLAMQTADRTQTCKSIFLLSGVPVGTAFVVDTGQCRGFLSIHLVAERFSVGGTTRLPSFKRWMES